MENDFSTPPAAEKFVCLGASPSFLAADDDVSEDSCSICLEPFTSQDPSTVTSCKHEYHLQCILEWSQRSKECPICMQILTLKDPKSQELVDAVERERSLRSRISTVSSGSLYGSGQWLSIGHDVPMDLEFDESVMQHVAAILSRDRDVRQREREESGSLPQSGTPVFRSPANLSLLQQSYEATGGDMHNLQLQSADGNFTMQPPSPTPPAAIHSPRVSERPRSPENSSFSESLKSKFSSASARYKDSISKGTRNLKERILARNSVKELSKGVQRKMSAGFTRLIERLDLNTKQSATPDSVSSSDDANAKPSSKGKGLQEDTTSPYTSSYAELCDLGTIPGRLEVVPSQGGQQRCYI